MTETSNVKCGHCKVPLKGPLDAKPEDRFVCPQCGNGDTRESVLREAGEYAKEQAAQYLEKQMAAVARNVSFIQFTPASRPRRDYRFIVDFDLFDEQTP